MEINFWIGMIIGLAIFFVPILLILYLIVVKYPVELRINIMSAYIVVVFSVTAIFFASFAAKQGVYPTSKYFGSKTTYAFDEKNALERLARLQIYISAGVGIIALVVVVLIILVNL